MPDEDGFRDAIIGTPQFVHDYAIAFRRLAIAKMVVVARLDGAGVIELFGSEKMDGDSHRFLKEALQAQDGGKQSGLDHLEAGVIAASASVTSLDDVQLRGLALKHHLGPFVGKASFSEVVDALFQERARLAMDPIEAYDHMMRLQDRFEGKSAASSN